MEVEEKEGAASVSTSGCLYRIGCALLPKKESRYLTSHILDLARKSGVEMCTVDPGQPLSEQGPFDVIIHKRQMDRDWERNLKEYCVLHPQMKVIDNVDSIRLLADRCTMLSIIDPSGIEVHRPLHTRRQSGSFQEETFVDKVVDRLDSPPRSREDSLNPKVERSTSLGSKVTVLAPPQVLITEGSSLEDVEEDLEAVGVGFPLVVKSQFADGREGSHLLAVVHDRYSVAVKDLCLHPLTSIFTIGEYPHKHYGVLGYETWSGAQGFVAAVSMVLIVCVSRPALEELLRNGSGVKPPFVVQEYVEHGGVLHKVYVVGSRTMCLQRPSLSLSKGNHSGLEVLPRISCQRRSTQDTSVQHQKRSPPEWVTHRLASMLRNRLDLQLFNFDMIQPQGTSGVFYVVDINYFPGVDKIRDFESIFVDFLLAACKAER